MLCGCKQPNGAKHEICKFTAKKITGNKGINIHLCTKKVEWEKWTGLWGYEEPTD